MNEWAEYVVANMGVDLATYRARIGSFFSGRNVNCDDQRRRKACAIHLCITAERFSAVAMSYTWIKKRLLLLSGDVEMNPGPLGQHVEGKETNAIAAHPNVLAVRPSRLPVQS